MRGMRALICAVALVITSMTLVGSPAEAKAGARGAQAVYHNPQVFFAGKVHARRGTATVWAVYRCWGGNENTHLWVSLKQGGGIRGKTAQELSQMEGTSRIARAWYDTNVVAPRLVTINCNGQWQVHKYTVKREKGTLHRGSAFLQFCLFDSHADPTGEDLSYGFAYKYKLTKVQKGHRR